MLRRAGDAAAADHDVVAVEAAAGRRTENGRTEPLQVAAGQAREPATATAGDR